MPYKTENLSIKDPFLDRRTKLLPCQREMIHHYYHSGESINSLAKRFQVNKRLIQFELFPERHAANIERRKERGGWKQYYNKDEHRDAVKEHRHYKNDLLKDVL